MSAMSIYYFDSMPWWRSMEIYKICSDASAPDAKGKLMSNNSPWRWDIANYKSCMDKSAPNAPANRNKTTTHHDFEAWKTTIRATDTTTPDKKANTVIYMNRHNHNAWYPKEPWFKAATPWPFANLLQKEINIAWRESKDIVECWDRTSAWLAWIRPCFDQVYCENELQIL